MIKRSEILEEAKQTCEQVASEKGFNLLDFRFLTTHPSDQYLFVSLTHNEKKDQYTTHLYNQEKKAFYEGYYTKSVKDAKEKFDNKR